VFRQCGQLAHFCCFLAAATSVSGGIEAQSEIDSGRRAGPVRHRQKKTASDSCGYSRRKRKCSALPRSGGETRGGGGGGKPMRDEEVAHTLRTLEIIVRTYIPPVFGASFPASDSRETSNGWEQLYGKVSIKAPWEIPVTGPILCDSAMRRRSLPRNPPPEDAAHFLIRMVP